MGDCSRYHVRMRDDVGPLLNVADLSVRFPVRRGVLGRVAGYTNAVDRVSFQLDRQQTLGLVGESGCGKTTVARAILRLIPASSGRVQFDGRSVLDLPREPMRRLRRQMQIIFQDPAGSLNPRMRVGRIVGEPLVVHGLAKGAQLQKQVEQALTRCGLWKDAAQRFPHEFSGGQRQRISIARALILRPKLILCDEPTSALDVSVQSQILNLLMDLQNEYGMSYLFISHDMAVVHHICHRIAVMWKGNIVEQGDCDDIVNRPQHEYTRSLLAAVPEPNPRAPDSMATVSA